MLNYTAFVNPQSRPVVNSSRVAPVCTFLFKQSPPLIKLTSSKSSSFSYLLRQPGYIPQRHYNLHGSLEVTRTRLYSGAFHA
jgi:hypothetical protein